LQLAVGFVLHMAFSMVVGVSFALVLLGAIRVLSCPWWRRGLAMPPPPRSARSSSTPMMMYVILPVAKPLMVDMTPRGAVIVEHILYGGVLGWWRASRWPRG
jgi:hypothetical protein